jgi:PBP1b-binding outer membrane lipoprotein LpoB
MMKKQTMRLALILILTLFLSGCALLYTDIKTPLPSLSTNTDAQSTTHVGKASCAYYVWVLALGDCSVQTAMQNGGISKVHHVDSEINSYFLGIYTKFTTVVYGE